MQLKDAVNVLASGGGFSNPLDSVSASLSIKAATMAASAHPSVRSCGESLSSLLASANAAVSSILGQIKVVLPTQKSANEIYNKLNSVTGEQGFFRESFAALTSQLTPLQDIDGAFSLGDASGMASLVPPADLDVGQAAILSGINSLISVAASVIYPIPAASANAINYGYSLLIAHAYAQFLIQPHSSHVQGVISASSSLLIDG